MNCSSCGQDLPETARFCPFCGTPRGAAPAAGVLPAPASAPSDERKPATVLFCDLVGSTALSEALDPEILRTVTLRYFAAMSERIEAHGGTPEKFIGDAVMAVFGVPVVREDDARRALAAALGMREALAGLNAELETSPGIRLNIRIGVNTGEVVAGSDTTARQALVSGETVNVAARLEQNAGPGEILIGRRTLLAAGPTVVVEEAGPLSLKGKSERVPAYRLLALGADDPELLRRFDVPFVGRRDELAALDRALGSTADGPMILRITGEAGVGKTRLVREWLSGRARRGDAPVHGSGRCRSYGEHGTLAPLADAVRGLLASTGSTAAAAPEVLAPPATPAAPETPSASPARAAARAAAAVSTATARAASAPSRAVRPSPDAAADREADDAMTLLAGGLLRDGTPNAPFEDMCAALATVLRRAARHRPVLLAFDDWHWAAPLLERALARLHALLGGAAVLTLCLGRPAVGPEGQPEGQPEGPAHGAE
ncbi:adenylate/guanylate cyclase domain-containing protein, partial [Streptomyces sp. GC420]|uniref:adenylate/guanylate cyclase domain-containing protein n=1 Tax=Streptomyces sp. GC420 TaxID=2697568 RepID=UPI0014150535